MTLRAPRPLHLLLFSQLLVGAARQCAAVADRSGGLAHSPTSAPALPEPLSWEFVSNVRNSFVPKPRMYFSMAGLFFEKRSANVSLLFGGLCGGPDDGGGDDPYHSHNDTWLFHRNHSWEPVAGNAPPPRFHHDMASTNYGTAIMFGGMFYEETRAPLQTFYADTWMFSVADYRWTQLHPTPGYSRDGIPAARALHRLAIFRPPNYTHPLVLMFGGRLGSQSSDTNETWVLEILGMEDANENKGFPTTDQLDAKWYLVPVGSNRPSSRTGHAMSPMGRDSVVLFGGYDSVRKELKGDTWLFIGASNTTASWHHISCSSMKDKTSEIMSDFYSPPKRRFASFASFDSETALLFGGTRETLWETHEGSEFSDASTWHLSRNTNNLSVPPEKRYTWRRIVAYDVDNVRPIARYGHAATVIAPSSLERDESGSSSSVFLFGGRGKLQASRKTYISTMDDTWIFHGGCPAGTYRSIDPITGCDGCYSCGKGTYKASDAYGVSSKVCKPCPKGTTTLFIGSTVVTQCTRCAFAKEHVAHNTGLCDVIGFSEADTPGSLPLPQNGSHAGIRAVWQCNPGWYGCGGGPDCGQTNVEWGHDCSKLCNCNGRPCNDGWTGDGKCHCGSFGYWFSRDDCKTQMWTILTLAAIALATGALIFVGVNAYKAKTNRYRYQRRMLQRDNMDLEVSAALLSEQHLQEISQFEDGWKIDENDLTWVTRLAAGGFGEVWKGKYVAFPGETVAIKKFFLMPDTIETIMERGAFADQEVAVLAKTPAHRNIVYVVGAGQLQRSKEIFLVSEFMDGGDLRDLLNGGVDEVCGGSASNLAEGKAGALLHVRRAPLPWRRRVQIARDVAEGMAFLHERGMIHRDLKSLNILLESGPRGKAKIADFGLSKFTGSHNAILRQWSGGTADEAAAALLREESKTRTEHDNIRGGDAGDKPSLSSPSLARGRAPNEMQQIAWQMYLGFTSTSAPFPSPNMATSLKNAQLRRDVCPKWMAKYEANKDVTHGNVFTGHDAVLWLIEWLERQHDRKCSALDASLLGSKLLQAGYFQYVRTTGTCENSYDKLLDDKTMLYVFNEARLRFLIQTDEPGGDSSGRNSVLFSGASTSTLSDPLMSQSSEQQRWSSGGTASSGGASGSGGGSGLGSRSGSGLDASPFQTRLTANMGSLFWMAPEVLGQRGGRALYGLATDVYSYGVMLYEMITRRYPWDDVEEPLQLRIITKVLGAERPTLTREEEQRAGVLAMEEGGALLLDLMRQAWAQDPQERPTFDAIAKRLASAMADSQ